MDRAANIRMGLEHALKNVTQVRDHIRNQNMIVPGGRTERKLNLAIDYIKEALLPAPAVDIDQQLEIDKEP